MAHSARPEKPAALNPFSSIWFRTRETVRYAIEEMPGRQVVLLIILAGFATALLSARNSEPVFFGDLLVSTVVFGTFIGGLMTAVLSALFVLTGKLFKGEAGFSGMFRAVTVSYIPQIWLVPFLLLWFALSPATFYQQGADWSLAFVLTLLIDFITIFQFIILGRAVSEAHRISLWKGFAIIIIPAAVLVLLLLF